MPPKGDSVEEGEIYLSTAISELKIIEQSNSMCIFEEKPARQYTVNATVIFL